MLIKKINISEIGEVEFVKSHKARNISIWIKPFLPVRVTVPRGVEYAEAEKFFLKKIHWLKHAIQKTKKTESRYTIFDNTTQFKTLEHILQLNPEARKNINIFVSGGIIKISYPDHADVKHPLIQRCIRKGIEEAWRIEANKYLPVRAEELAKKFGFTIKAVSVRNSKTRWGSCSIDNNITLSIHLIRLPQHLIDYVILHEMVHTVHKNHGPKYHETLSRILPNEKQLSRALTKYNINVY
ncbi:MAG: DUF45 domain-containing protein [Bacteroidia bacterium]|nr:DUF45 domain-containing protein [Bacteroidia bacterium]